MLKVLLTNIQTIAKLNRPVNQSKSPYFDQKWSKNAGFAKNTDRARYETPEISERDHTAQINDQILVLHKIPMNSERRQFLSRVAGESVDFIAAQRAILKQLELEDTLGQTSMTAMVEHLFEILKAYAYELNSVVGFSALHMAATNPQTVTEIVRFDKMRNPLETVTHVRARLSTSRFSLVLRGTKNGIDFYIIPVARAIGLSKQENHYQPVASLITRFEGTLVTWETADEKPLTSYRIETICMELFHALIEETKRQVALESDLEGPAELRRRVG